MELGPGIQDTTPHLSFYLFMLQQLAYPNALTCLFPDHDDGSPMRIPSNGLPETLKAVFRYLNDPESAAAFSSQQLEGLVVQEACGDSPSCVPLDPLVRVSAAPLQDVTSLS